MNDSVRVRAGLRARWLSVVAVMALLDWILAVSSLAAGVRRDLMVPLLVVAACAGLGVHVPRLRRVVREVAAVGRGERWAAAEVALGRELGPRLARLVLREPQLWWSLVMLVRGRRDGEPHPTYTGFQDALPTWVTLGVVAVLEVGLTLLLPLPRWVGTALLILGLWGLVVVFGLAAALIVHPHVVEPRRVRLRIGFWTELAVPRQSIGRVNLQYGTVNKGLSLTGGRAGLSASGSVNLMIHLTEPLVVQGVSVTAIWTWVDTPAPMRADLCGLDN
jgi:hypothetical protein